MQQLNLYPPSNSMEIWLNEPRRAEHSQAPGNLLRLCFPESIIAFDSGNNILWQWTFEQPGSPWQYENLSIGDMKNGRKVRKALSCTKTIGDLALVKCIARWDGVEADLALSINNIGPVSWNRLTTSICLQRPAAPEYIDEDNSRTFVVSNEGFVSSAELIFPEDRNCVYGFVGEELPMRNGSKRILAEEVLFVRSKDEHYVLGYAWHDARRLFLNRSLCVRCLHSDLEVNDIEPKTVMQRRGILFLKEGKLEDALERYRTWKHTSGAALSVNEL